ncbi:MAG: response regulator [Nitrospirae bacterium]|nr:response regulator [Nitrospirota bacterium]
MSDSNYILIVEDSHTQARQIELSLKQLGHPVSIACNAKDALTILGKQKALIVIADILMPEMDGYQLCSKIKSDPRLVDIPVVLLTQLSDSKEIIKGLECGADDFIVKPYSEELLLTRIQTILHLKAKFESADRQVRILVVEDSPTQAEQIKYLLEERGYTVLIASDGREGLKAARETMPTIIISDILMPVMDGYELAYEIKHDEGLKHIPVILITSLMDRKEVLRKASVVADGYFTKPFDDKYLLEKVEALISASTHADEGKDLKGVDVTFGGEHYVIASGRHQILNFLLSIYENAVQQNQDLILMQRELQALNEQLEEKVLERTQELEASEINFRTLAENANDGIVIVNNEGRHAYANKRTTEITGYSVNELLNTGIKDLAHPDVFPTIMEIFKKRLAGIPQPGQYETVIIRKDGKSIPIEITSSKTLWHGRPAAIVILRDISIRKKMEDEFLKVSKLESISTLAGGIAHDFNNLLTGILGNVSLIKAYVSPEERTYNTLTNIEKASLKAKDLTQQLLTFAKGGTPVKNTVSIAGLIMDSANFVLSGSSIRCDFSIAEDLCLVDIDEGQINQVIHNLVLNAEQARPKDGIIRISAENVSVKDEDNLPVKVGKYVRLTINDSGIGIPGENLDRIFDPYFTTKNKGSGLGLATVYSIISNHDGYIMAESEVGTGTTFSIYLPISRKQVKVFPVKDVGEKPIPGKGRILVMDDEEIIRDVAGSMLSSLGYKVDFAKDGAEAIRLYKKAKEEGLPFDAVIMDITIPGGMGGRKAIDKLREIDPAAKAIVSSGYSDDAIMSDFRKYGFSAVIAKPYRLFDLSKVVYQVIKG